MEREKEEERKKRDERGTVCDYRLNVRIRFFIFKLDGSPDARLSSLRRFPSLAELLPEPRSLAVASRRRDCCSVEEKITVQ